MKLPHDKRWRWGLGSVATTLVIVLTVSANPQDKEVSTIAQPTPRKQASEPASAASGDKIDSISLERLKRSRMGVKKAEIFGAKSWYVPPPPPPPTPPPPPSAPPLPFIFLGKIQESEGKPIIFLSGGDRVYLVREGETIDDTYSVDGIADGKLELTYLPLKIKQYINMGEAH